MTFLLYIRTYNVYMCMLHTSFSLHVCPLDPAEVTGTSGSHQVLTGRSVTLSCTVSAIPAATVRWYKDNVMLSSGANTTYTISSAQSSDSGMYQCFVSNAHGDGEGSVSVQVRDSGQYQCIQLCVCNTCVCGLCTQLTETSVQGQDVLLHLIVQSCYVCSYSQ